MLVKTLNQIWMYRYQLPEINILCLMSYVCLFNITLIKVRAVTENRFSCELAAYTKYSIRTRGAGVLLSF